MIILVLEDEPFTAMDLMTALNADGHEVLGPAMTINEALAIADKRPPQLALLNINLPDGSGIEAASELHQRYGCRCLFVSGRSQLGPLAGEAALGFLSKPFEIEAVLQSIEVVQAVIEGRPHAELPAQLELYPKAEVSVERPAA